MVCDRAVIAEQAARSASVDERRCSWHRSVAKRRGGATQEVSAREPSLGHLGCTTWIGLRRRSGTHCSARVTFRRHEDVNTTRMNIVSARDSDLQEHRLGANIASLHPPLQTVPIYSPLRFFWTTSSAWLTP